MISILIWLLVIGVIIGLVYFVADALPIPQPLNRIIKMVAVVIACILIIMVLLQLIGVGPGLNVPVIVN